VVAGASKRSRWHRSIGGLGDLEMGRLVPGSFDAAARYTIINILDVMRSGRVR
jgi:hypothetical protein